MVGPREEAPNIREGLILVSKLIFDTVDTGLCNDGIDMCKQYRRVLIQARATLCMRKVYVSTRPREIGKGIW